MSDDKTSEPSDSEMHALQLEVAALRAEIDAGKDAVAIAEKAIDTELTQYQDYREKIRELGDENRTLKAHIVDLEQQVEAAQTEALVYLKSSLSGNQRGLFLRNQLVAYQNEIKKLRSQ